MTSSTELNMIPSRSEHSRLDLQDVSELLLLGPQVFQVVGVGHDLERSTLDDLDPAAADPGPLAGIVGEQADLTDSEIGEDLRAHAIVAEIGREAELEVRLDRVEPLLVLELVGLDLVRQPDPSPLLPHVEQDAGPGLRNRPKRGVELLAAITAQRSERVSGQALAVDAHQRGPVGADLAQDERHVI